MKGTSRTTLEKLYNQKLLDAIDLFHRLYHMSLKVRAKLFI